MNATPNATMTRFGWPTTKIAELDHWAVALRVQQPTAGSLVVICKQPVTAFHHVDEAGFAELRRVVATVEPMLTELVAYERINWLMLMMVDPDVHFHVIPRYQGNRTLAGVTVPDHGWPGPPALGDVVEPGPEDVQSLVTVLRDAWASAFR